MDYRHQLDWSPFRSIEVLAFRRESSKTHKMKAAEQAGPTDLATVRGWPRALGHIHMSMRTFSRSQFSRFLREARRAHRAVPGAEICGLIVDTGFHLSLVQARNASRRSGSFVFARPDVRRIVAAVEVLGQEVVGTFHSHPVASARPGQSDIANAVDNSLMLIFDCAGCSARLWRIRSGRAREVGFRLRPNQSDQPTSIHLATRLKR